jgi:hypothetical protein
MKALMPKEPSMVMLYGKGGHLSTIEYSVIVARNAKGKWRGTAVGRSRIQVMGAPYSPMTTAEWELNGATSQQLEQALSHRCPFRENRSSATPPEAPPLGHIPERIDVVTSGRTIATFYADAEDGAFAAIIRPPKSTNAASDEDPATSTAEKIKQHNSPPEQ